MGVLLALLLTLVMAPFAVARDSAITWNNRGVDLYSAGKYQAAISAYEKAIKINPRYVDAYSNRGVAYDALNQPERAIIDYSRAIEINPSVTASYINRGLAYTDLARWDDAIADWNIVLKRQPRNADAHYRRGFCYQSKANLDKALADYERSCKLNPRLAKASRARDMVRKALALAPSTAESSFTPLPMEKPPVQPAEDPLSKLAERHEKAEEATPPQMVPAVPHGSMPSFAHVLSKPQRRLPQGFIPVPFGPVEFCTTAAQHMFGNACCAVGQYGPAIKSYSGVVSINPNDYFAYYRRGNAYLRAGMKDLAVEDYDRALALNPAFRAASTKREKVVAEMRRQ